MNEFVGFNTIKVDGATVEFYEKKSGNSRIIGFDSRACVPPEPMINAMLALNLISGENDKVIMLNHRFPVGLIPKIEPFFNYTQSEFEGGVQLEFSPKAGVEIEKFKASQMECK
ncbi:hypothetical protein [Campylobacter sp. 19-13652]|uniref:hypothetical protein n=1 Tax=Campylobacter sp. 19-13652 TaxID=2840180 RepID=UPI001C79002F|nr:hypothetical protein [Campylobacter sp. 19-13652]BCX79545.1 hypothetical protein LBC_10070 [Campylobacter sp. 19-13652]